MPYKIEKIKLPERLDRRRKLTNVQKETIRCRYQTEKISLRALGKEYGVNHKTILLIVNPEVKRKNDQYLKENWKRHQQSREEHAAAVKRTRHYKHDLYLKGEI